jgi:hypothetical protein
MGWLLVGIGGAVYMCFIDLSERAGVWECGSGE